MSEAIWRLFENVKIALAYHENLPSQLIIVLFYLLIYEHTCYWFYFKQENIASMT